MYANDMLESSNEDKVFQTSIGMVTISAEKRFFAMLLKRYRDIVKEANKEFKSYCTLQPKTKSDLLDISNSFDICKNYIYREVLIDLTSLDIYDITQEVMEDIFNNKRVFWRFQAILAALYDLCDSGTCTTSYREIYAEDVQLFYENMDISIENYITNEDILRALYQSFEGLDIIISKTVFSLIGSIGEYSFDVETVFGEGEKLIRCQRLLTNIKQGIIPQEKTGEILYEIISINPFYPSTYFEMLKAFGDSNGEVQSLANFLGYEELICFCKDEMIKDYTTTLRTSTEAETIQSKNKFIEYCKYLGCSNIADYSILQEFDKIISEYDLLYRTVDGVVFEKRIDADIAKKELPAIQEYMSHINEPNFESSLDYEQNLKIQKAEFDLKFSSKVKEKYIDLMDKYQVDFDFKYRTVDGVVCKTREGAELARLELKEITLFMKSINPPNSESLLDYEENLMIKRKELDAKIKSELKEKYMAQIDKYLIDFDKKFCTVGFFKKEDRKQAGKEKALKYAKKLDCSTVENAEKADILLREFLPKVGISLDEAEKAVQYLDKKRNNQDLQGAIKQFFKR